MHYDAKHPDCTIRTEYLSTEGAASFTSLSTAYITKLRISGVLPAVVIGGKCIRYRIEDLRTYMEERTVGGGKGRPARGSVPQNLAESRRRKRTLPNVIHPAPPVKGTGDANQGDNR